MRICCLPLIVIALEACTPAVSEPAGPCTENFCLPDGAKITLTQEGPDFNVHDVSWMGQRFGIYEGNHPQKGIRAAAQPSNSALTPGPALASRRGVAASSSPPGKAGPPFWDVMGPCRSDKDCTLVRFAEGLRGR